MPPPPWPLLVLLVALCQCRAFHHHHASSLQAAVPRRRLVPRSTPRDDGCDHDRSQQLQLLVLFKGGDARGSDRGTSLACLRESEFRGLARALLPKTEREALRFTEALEVDLSLAAGHGGAPGLEEEDGEEEEEDEDSSTSTDGGSSLMYVEGVEGEEALRLVASRALLVHAAYEVRVGIHGSKRLECVAAGARSHQCPPHPFPGLGRGPHPRSLRDGRQRSHRHGPAGRALRGWPGKALGGAMPGLWRDLWAEEVPDRASSEGAVTDLMARTHTDLQAVSPHCVPHFSHALSAHTRSSRCSARCWSGCRAVWT